MENTVEAMEAVGEFGARRGDSPSGISTSSPNALSATTSAAVAATAIGLSTRLISGYNESRGYGLLFARWTWPNHHQTWRPFSAIPFLIAASPNPTSACTTARCGLKAAAVPYSKSESLMTPLQASRSPRSSMIDASWIRLSKSPNKASASAGSSSVPPMDGGVDGEGGIDHAMEISSSDG